MTLRPTRPDDLSFVTALERRPDNVEMIGQWSDEEHLAAIAGTAALAAYLDLVFARPGVEQVWLIVRNHNSRARAVYEKLGFAELDPASEAAKICDSVAEAPPEKCFRMRKLGPGPLPQ